MNGSMGYIMEGVYCTFFFFFIAYSELPISPLKGRGAFRAQTPQYDSPPSFLPPIFRLLPDGRGADVRVGLPQTLLDTPSPDWKVLCGSAAYLECVDYVRNINDRTTKEGMLSESCASLDTRTPHRLRFPRGIGSQPPQLRAV